MASSASIVNIPLAPGEDKNTISVSVRLPAKLAKLVRQAAARQDTTRSGFMAQVAIREARVVMELQREDDFRAWLAAA